MGKRREKTSTTPRGIYLAALLALRDWFERQKRVLPWRDRPTLYRVWISEIMLQQTQVITVVPYFERFLERFPTVEALAQAPEDAVLAAWAGLGYYSRARNIHRAAQQIVERGGFPKDREGWLDVPGVGPYTAGAILSIALNLPEAILDGNVERVLSRVRRVSRTHGEAIYKVRLWRLARVFVRDGARHDVRPSQLNQALMELGATVCTPRNPRCEQCPIQPLCRAFAAGEAEAYPPKKKPKEWIQVQEQMDCFLDDRNRVWVEKRSRGEWRAGLWDLPGQRTAAKATQSPKPGNRPFVRHAQLIGEVQTKHVVTRHKIVRTTRIWRVPARWTAAETDPNPAEREAQARWVEIDQEDLALGSAFHRTLEAVRRRLDALL